ncbi:MAG TPA: Hsp70 family protein, partial [Burkholderiales bacterium]|nr:Hsp70 family protein [Burkholderiales bacterium]
PFRTPEVRRAVERMPFTLIESDNGGVDVRVRAERYSLPEISAFVLRRARVIAEEAVDQTCSHVVVTVPASFNELQRTATRDAGRIAGLHVLRILNEPTAAALAYGFGAKTDRRIAIYDLGGGTFDLSILDLSGDVIEVIATAGDSYLGGDDVDALIADRMAASFLAQHRVDLSSDPQAYERLRVAAEWLKVQLSSTERAHVRVEQAAYGAYGVPIDLEFSLTRAEHDQLLSPLVQRTFDICESAMRVASLRPSQVDEVILVGGQTMAPRVRALVEQYFGRPPLTTVNPSHVVAEGAAVLGYALTGGKPAAAPAPTRARPEGSLGLNTLVPPAPSVPPPSAAPVSVPASPTFSPTPSPLSIASVRPSLARAEATLTSVPAPDVSLPSRSGTLRGAAPVKVPPPPALPVFPGFDDDEEPTRISDRAGLRDSDMSPAEIEPLRETPDRTESLYTSFDDEPTQHSAPRMPSDAPSASERPSPTPRPPTSGVPLAAVTLNKRPSAPPPPMMVSATRTEPMMASAPASPPFSRTLSKAPPPPPPPPPAAVSVPPPSPAPRRGPSTKPPVSSRPPAIAAPPPAVMAIPPPARLPMPSVPPPAPPAPPAPVVLPAPPAPPAALPVTAPMRPETFAAAAVTAPTRAPEPAPAPAQLASVPPPVIDIEEPRAPLLLDVTPLTLAIETAGGFCEPIIERNAPIPTEQTRRFSTSQDNQSSVRMRICQGEERRADNNQLLGTIELTELRAAARGVVKIEVTFMIDADGTLSVRARDEATRKAHRVRIDLVGGLREQDVARMYKRQKSLNVRG